MVSALHAHPVFGTNYRRGVPTAEHTTYLREVFTKACQDFGATLAERNGQDNHINPLAGYPPEVSNTTLDGPANSGLNAGAYAARFPVPYAHRPPSGGSATSPR